MVISEYPTQHLGKFVTCISDETFGRWQIKPPPRFVKKGTIGNNAVYWYQNLSDVAKAEMARADTGNPQLSFERVTTVITTVLP